MKLVFLGPPGAGKGTQAKLIANDKDLAHISTGDMLRAAVSSGSKLGLQVKSVLDSGQLVPDDLIVRLIEKRVEEEDCKVGYILDGFPRTVGQAQALQRMLEGKGTALSGVLLFQVSEEDLRTRLAIRRNEQGRADDDEQVQLERLRVYERETKPLIEFYDRLGFLRRVDASGNIEEISKKVAQVVSGLV